MHSGIPRDQTRLGGGDGGDVEPAVWEESGGELALGAAGVQGRTGGVGGVQSCSLEGLPPGELRGAGRGPGGRGPVSDGQWAHRGRGSSVLCVGPRDQQLCGRLGSGAVLPAEAWVYGRRGPRLPRRPQWAAQTRRAPERPWCLRPRPTAPHAFSPWSSRQPHHGICLCPGPPAARAVACGPSGARLRDMSLQPVKVAGWTPLGGIPEGSRQPGRAATSAHQPPSPLGAVAAHAPLRTHRVSCQAGR